MVSFSSVGCQESAPRIAGGTPQGPEDGALDVDNKMMSTMMKTVTMATELGPGLL